MFVSIIHNWAHAFQTHLLLLIAFKHISRNLKALETKLIVLITFMIDLTVAARV